MNEQFQQAARAAEENFTVTDCGVSETAVYLSAEAGTGTRYSVVIARMPDNSGSREGGQHLISLLQPWQTSMVFTVDGSQIHSDYLLEKLVPRDRTLVTIHGGDAMAVCMAVNEAVQMMAVVDGATMPAVRL